MLQVTEHGMLYHSIEIADRNNTLHFSHGCYV